MDILSIVRTIGALGFVLGLLAGALWLTKRYDLRLPQRWLVRIGGGIGGTSRQRRLELVERLALDPRRSIVLVRRDDTEFSILLAPEGVTVLPAAAGSAAPKTATVPAPETTAKTDAEPRTTADA